MSDDAVSQISIITNILLWAVYEWFEHNIYIWNIILRLFFFCRRKKKAGERKENI